MQNEEKAAVEIKRSSKLLRIKNEPDPVGATNNLRGLAAKIKFIFINIAYWSSKINCKPTNTAFIALIADKLQLQLKGGEVVNF